MAITFAMDVNPDGDLTRSLGSSSNKWKVNGHVTEIVEISVSATSDTSVTIGDSNITENHVVLNSFNTSSDISYTTSNGSVVLTCSSGIPAITLYFGVKE